VTRLEHLAGAYCFEPTIQNNDAVDSSESESSVADSESELDSYEEKSSGGEHLIPYSLESCPLTRSP